VEENRRALQLGDISEVTRARHLGWLAYNLAYHDQRGQRRAAANEAAAAAAATGDLEARIMADVTLARLECGDGYAGRSIRRLEELARPPARVMRPQPMTWPHSTTRTYWRWSAGWTTLRPRSPTE
jgi:hypothetical protein